MAVRNRVVAGPVRNEYGRRDLADPLVHGELVLHQQVDRQEPVAIMRDGHRRVERRFEIERVGLP